MTLMRELGPYLALIVVGFLPNEIWRMLGVVFAHGLDEKSEVLVLVRAVATAILGGVIGDVVLVAPGTLAQVPLAVRLTAVAVGFLGFLLVRRSVFAGVLAGEAALAIGALLAGH
jgi:hypothetical protein